MPLPTAQEALKQYFGYDTFRPLQSEIIQTILDKKDSVVLMPTGGGKSLCFQIPALITEGLCIVVSPLISLMRDQVEGLKANGVRAAFLNSSLTGKQYMHVESLATSHKLDLLYVSPEKLITPAFLQFIKYLPVNLFAIDEAHCISAWGHDFRPEYTQLKILKEQFPDVPITALTATADKLTRQDIVRQLNLNSPEIFIASFDRPNLSLTVLPGRKRFEIIRDFIASRQNESGIIYCLSRKSTENVAAKLQKLGIKATHYHAGLESEERSMTQDAFINDRTTVICATIAFGMGIDKSNVRWVIHYNLPKNIESYYQEIGRAGRDGLKSDTILFYSYGDVMVLRGFIEDSRDASNKEVQLNKLQSIMEYADSMICRRKILLNYFGENYDKDCGNCDVCKNPPAYLDGTITAQKALSAILRLQEKVASGILIDVLRGSGRKEIFERGFNNIKTYGAGSDVSFQDWQQYILQMIQMGLVEVAYDDYNNLKVTEAGKAILFKGKKVEFVTAETIKQKIEDRIRQSRPKSKRQMVKDDLFEKLRELRRTIASRDNIPAYLVFNDATLQEMAAERPVTQIEMMRVSGVGEQKYIKYGEVFINEILSFIQEKAKEGTKIKGSTYVLTFEAFKRGLTPNQIAHERKLSPETIFTHFARLYEDGYEIEIMPYFQDDELTIILEAIKKTGVTDKLKDLYDHLKGKIEYHKLRLGVAYYKMNVQVKQ
jgi:ATP-dependent DNA helicase RecQ